MSIAQQIGRNLCATVRQRPLTNAEVQTWSGLAMIEGLPDGGLAQVESSELSNMHAFHVARELCKSYLQGYHVRPTVCAWIAFHSQGKLSRVTMWVAILAAKAPRMFESRLNANPERWGEMARSRVVTMQLLQEQMNHMIPSEEHFDTIWEEANLVNGKHELNDPRSWI